MKHLDQMFVISATMTTNAKTYNVPRYNPTLIENNNVEADLRIVLHFMVSADEYNRLIVISNDTDVAVIILHYLKRLCQKGATEVYMRGGVGNTTRYIPLHIIASNIGELKCEVLPALRALTGTDATSKFGTKQAALKLGDSHLSLLQTFGR